MKNSSSISCHQAGAISAIMLLVLKITSLPSLMHNCSEVGGVVAICLICASNIAFLALIVWLKKRYNNSLFNIFSNFLGTFITKFLYLILLIFFIFKLLALLDEGFGFIRDVADEEFSYLNFIICFFPVICALAHSGIRNLSRTCEFFFPFILIALFVSIIFSFAPINFWGLGSVSRLNMGCVFRILTNLSFWNGDIFAVLMFMDKIELKKGSIKNIFSPILLISLFLIIAYVMYFSLYQETSILHSNMIFDIIEYSVGTSSGWHMDIFAILVYMVLLFLQGGIYMYSALIAVNKIFNYNNKTFTLTALVIILVCVQFLYLNDYLKYVAFASKYLSVASIVVLLLIPLLILIAILNKRRKYESNF